MNKNGLLYTILFTFVVSFILVIPLALANEATKPLVAQNEKLASARSVLAALGVEVEGKSREELLSTFDTLKTVKVQTAGGSKILPPDILYVLDTGAEQRFAGFFAGPGLWGQISMAIGFDAELQRLSGVRVYKQAETPGLGGRIDELWFNQQFTNQSIAEGSLLFTAGSSSKNGNTNPDDNTVDGITGATLTSNGVRDIVNGAIQQMKTWKAQGGTQ